MESAELHQFNVLLWGETIIRLTNISQAYFGLQISLGLATDARFFSATEKRHWQMALWGQIEAENRATASDVQ